MRHLAIIQKGESIISTDSPDYSYYYQFRDIDERSPCIFTCDLAFMDRNDLLIYCTGPNRMAGFIPDSEQLKFVHWISDSLAYFIEYRRNDIRLCILDLYNKIMHTRNENDIMENKYLCANINADMITEMGWIHNRLDDKDTYLKNYESEKNNYRWIPPVSHP